MYIIIMHACSLVVQHAQRTYFFPCQFSCLVDFTEPHIIMGFSSIPTFLIPFPFLTSYSNYYCGLVLPCQHTGGMMASHSWPRDIILFLNFDAVYCLSNKIMFVRYTEINITHADIIPFQWSAGCRHHLFSLTPCLIQWHILQTWLHHTLLF